VTKKKLLVITIYIENEPLPEDWKRLGDMISEGYVSGINRPLGMTWKLERDEK
jgi:hypothetical protein